MSLGSRVESLRRTRGESLQQTANAVGTSKGHLWQIERGKADKPSITLVTAIARHFSTTVGFLIGEDPGAQDADPEMAALYRDAASLSDSDREILQGTMRMLLDRAKRAKPDE